MVKKARCTTCSTGWCKNHLFELNPIFTNLYHRKNFKIRLCPRQNKQNSKFQRIIPIFNTDKKHYTPSFIIDQEKKYYVENDKNVLKNHIMKCQSDKNLDQTIYVARHNRKRNYCFACKSDYVDYLEHVDDIAHKKCLRSNPYTSLILQTQAVFEKQHKIQVEIKKLDQNKREMPTEQSSSISEQSPKSFQFIQKLIHIKEPIVLDPQIKAVVGN